MTEREGGGCILLNSYLLQLEVFFIELQLCLPILVVDLRAPLITSEKLTIQDASEYRVPPAICKRKGGAKAPPILPANESQPSNLSSTAMVSGQGGSQAGSGTRRGILYRGQAGTVIGRCDCRRTRTND